MFLTLSGLKTLTGWGSAIVAASNRLELLFGKKAGLTGYVADKKRDLSASLDLTASKNIEIFTFKSK